MDHAGTRAKALAMQAAYGYWRPLLSCSSLPTKVRLLMVQTFIYSAVMYGAEVWDTTKAVKDKMSAVVKLSAAFWPASPRLLFRCSGTLGYFHPVYSLMLPNCVGSTDLRTWRLAMRFSRVAVVSAGLRWARTGAVMWSITEQIHTLNIAKVTAQARVNQPCVG
jgi:hypothetical protein